MFFKFFANLFVNPVAAAVNLVEEAAEVAEEAAEVVEAVPEGFLDFIPVPGVNLLDDMSIVSDLAEDAPELVDDFIFEPLENLLTEAVGDFVEFGDEAGSFASDAFSEVAELGGEVLEPLEAGAAAVGDLSAFDLAPLLLL